MKSILAVLLPGFALLAGAVEQSNAGVAEVEAEQAQAGNCPRIPPNCPQSSCRPLCPRKCEPKFPGECPPGYELIGSYDHYTSIQKWSCIKYKKNCDVECDRQGQGFAGFCQADTQIALDGYKVPECIFLELMQVITDTVITVNKTKDGFFVILQENASNAGCKLCKNGVPVCLKRIPYFEALSFGIDLD